MSTPSTSARPLAVVTGASQGLGEAIAERLAARGWDLLLVARQADRLQALADRLADAGASAHVLAVDLAEAAGVEAVLDWCARYPGRIEGLVNNAGFGDTTPFLDQEWETVDGMLRLNLVALVRLTHGLGRRFRDQGKGRILNVASTAAFQPNAYFAAYGATKAFALLLSEAVHEELAGSGVTVTTLCPGPTRTPFHGRARTGGSPIARLAMMDVAPVADAGVRGMLRGDAVVVPGWINRLLLFTVRLGPRAAVRQTSARLMRPTPPRA